MTPASLDGSEGSQSSAPTIASLPRGSLTTAERKPSKSLRKRSRRSVIGPRPRSGPPATTTRVGSPPVCESITLTRCALIPIQMLIREQAEFLLRHAPRGVLLSLSDRLHDVGVRLG